MVLINQCLFSYIFDLRSVRMACGVDWKEEDLQRALLMVKEENMSLREASFKCEIPKSTLYDHFMTTTRAR